MKTRTVNFSNRVFVNKALLGRRINGFSLIELMIVISISAILTSITIPSFNDALLSNKLRTYANNLVASVYLARSEAIKRNAVVTLCASNNGTSCSGNWENGWIVLSSTNAVIQTQQAIDGNYKIAGGANALLFQPTGIGSTQVVLIICRETPIAGSQERVLAISATGKPSVTKTTTGSC